jgi:hypothetical protein
MDLKEQYFNFCGGLLPLLYKYLSAYPVAAKSWAQDSQKQAMQALSSLHFTNDFSKSSTSCMLNILSSLDYLLSSSQQCHGGKYFTIPLYKQGDRSTEKLLPQNHTASHWQS